MAVTPMLKMTLIGHGQVMDEVLAAVQRAGVLEVEAQPFELESAGLEPEHPARLEAEEQYAEASFVANFLSRFHTSDTPFKMFIAEKTHVNSADFFDMRYSLHMRSVYRECVGIADRLAAAERETDRLQALLVDLAPWQDLRLEISRWRGTEHTRLLTGTVPLVTGPAIRAALRERVADVTVQEQGPIGDRQAWVVIAMADALEEVRAVLATSDFTEVSFPGLEDYPAEEAEAARDRIAELARDTVRLEARATTLAEKNYSEAVALVQALESKRDAVRVRADIGRTERAFVITGWIASESTDALEKALEAYRDAVDVSVRGPQDDEEPPVGLTNRPWLRPFEILTDLYGRPSYRGLDPTPLLAPFFLLFFALCIGDVGYGLMLVVGAFLIKTRLDVAPGVKRFMDLLITGGAASMVVGVFLGSYLALPVDSLPQVLQGLQLLDPVEDIQQFLLLALGIGAVQVIFGVLVAAYIAVRQGDIESALFDQLSILGLMGALTVTAVAGASGNGDLVRASLVIGLVGAMIMQGRAVQVAVRSDEGLTLDRVLGIGWSVVLVGGMLGYALVGSLPILWTVLLASAVGLFVSKSIRRGVVGVLAGAYNVYGLTGFAGDMLSYLRLPALGLSGTLVGSVFNILTGLVWDAATPLMAKGGISWVFAALVALMAVAIFAVGHTFNVVINLLGAFVHPARLQFVEFFGKFYEAGGQPFKPLRFRTDGLVLDAGAAGKEGGRVS